MPTGKFPINEERLLPNDPACRAKGQKTPVWDLGDSCQGNERVERIPLLIKLQPPPTCQVLRLQNSTAFNVPTARVLMKPENLYHFKVRATPPGIFVVSAQQMGVGMGGWDFLSLVTESWNQKGTTHTCPFPQQRTSPSLLNLLPLCGFGT